MGNQCCQQQKIITHTLDVSSKIKKSDFSLVQSPKDDRFLAQKMKLHNELQTIKVMKHLHLEKYYWGNWVNQQPVGKGFLYQPDQYFYHGNFNSKPNDYGEIQFLKTGLKYKGQILQGKAEGLGQLTHKNNLYHYDGLWKNSVPVSGSLQIRQQQNKNKITTVVFDQFPMNDSKISYSDGRTYIGTIHQKKFIPEGRGKVTYPDSNTYEGQWSDGQFHGQGIYTWSDGSSYEGNYQYGKKHGFGKYIYKSGSIYQGEWIQSLQHGRGTLFNFRGVVSKKGIWRSGKFLTSQQL